MENPDASLNTQISVFSLINPNGKLKLKESPSNGGFVLIFENFVEKNNKCIHACLNFDGTLLLTLDVLGNATLFYLKQNRYFVFAKSKKFINAEFIKFKEEYICIVSQDKSIEIYSALTHKSIQQISGHKLNIQEISTNKIKNYLLTVSGDCCIIWDISDFKKKKSIFSGRFKFTKAKFSEDGMLLIILDEKNKICIYDANFHLINQAELSPNLKITSLSICNNTQNIYLGGNFDLLIKYNISSENIDGICEGVINSAIKLLTTFNNYMIVLNNGGSQILILELSNENKMIFDFSLPSNHMIKDCFVDFQNSSIGFISSIGNVYIYDFKKIMKKFENPKITFAEDQSKSLFYQIPKDHTNFERRPLSTVFEKENISENIKRNPKSDNNAIEEMIITTNPPYIKPKTSHSNATLKKNGSNQDNKTFVGRSQGKMMEIKSNLLNKENLKNYLNTFSHFPDNNRGMIWKFLLSIPENKEAFQNLMKKGIHEKYLNLYEEKKLESQHLFRKLQRVLSALTFYCPSFGNVGFLADMVFPFIKLFSFDDILSFEIILSFFLNWGQHLFEFNPNPPINLFKAIETIVNYYDEELYSVLKSHKSGFIIILWPSLQVLFTDILSREKWLELMDYLFLSSDKPENLLYFLSSILLINREIFLKQQDISPISLLLSKKEINIKQIWAKINQIDETLPSSLLSLKFKSNLPIIKGQYNLFDFGPIYDLDENRKLRERLKKEERKFLEEQNSINKISFSEMEKIIEEKNRQILAEQKRLNNLVFDEADGALMRQESLLKEREGFLEKRKEESMLRAKLMEKQLVEKLNDMKEKEQYDKNKLDDFLKRKIIIADQEFENKLEEETLSRIQQKIDQKMNFIVGREKRKEEEKRRKEEEYLQNKEKEINFRYTQIQNNYETNLLNLEEKLNDRKGLAERLLADEEEMKLKEEEAELKRRRAELELLESSNQYQEDRVYPEENVFKNSVQWEEDQ